MLIADRTMQLTHAELAREVERLRQKIQRLPVAARERPLLRLAFLEEQLQTR